MKYLAIGLLFFVANVFAAEKPTAAEIKALNEVIQKNYKESYLYAQEHFDEVVATYNYNLKIAGVLYVCEKPDLAKTIMPTPEDIANVADKINEKKLANKEPISKPNANWTGNQAGVTFAVHSYVTGLSQGIDVALNSIPEGKDDVKKALCTQMIDITEKALDDAKNQ